MQGCYATKDTFKKAKNFFEKYGKDLKKSKEEGWGQLTVKDEDISKITGEVSALKSEILNLRCVHSCRILF